jgi:hypothetical protein
MREFLHKASMLYYEGSPILSDAEFDLLAQKHHYNAVGYTVTVRFRIRSRCSPYKNVLILTMLLPMLSILNTL